MQGMSPSSFFSLFLWSSLRWAMEGKSLYRTQQPGCSLCLWLSRLQVLLFSLAPPSSPNPHSWDATLATLLWASAHHYAFSSVTTCLYRLLGCPTHGCCPAGAVLRWADLSLTSNVSFSRHDRQETSPSHSLSWVRQGELHSRASLSPSLSSQL